MLLSTVTAPINISTNSAKGLTFLNSYPLQYLLFVDHYFDKHEAIAHCGFNLHLSGN